MATADRGFLSSPSCQRGILPQEFESWLLDESIPIEKLESLLEQHMASSLNLRACGAR